MFSYSKSQYSTGISQFNPSYFQHDPRVPSVLVEDEERIRRFCAEFFRDREMTLYVFSSEKEFRKSLPKINFPAQFYLDQDFGTRRGVGVQLARELKALSQPWRIHLITVYSYFDFAAELSQGLLSFVLPKYPVNLFGANFLKYRMNQEFQDFGVESFIHECGEKLSAALEDFPRSVNQGDSLKV